MNCMNILTLETTCDETAAAVVNDRLEVLGSVVASQDELHRRFGGVVPEIASRAHLERILPVIDETLRRAGLTLADIDAVAVANTPGLAGSLLVGLVAAKTICVARQIPLVAVNHLQAHVYACRLAAGRDVFPCVGLIVSGGHTSLYRCRGRWISSSWAEPSTTRPARPSTRWPPCSGCRIPAARRSNGPPRRATRGPTPSRGPSSTRTALDFSFSGLKTAVRYAIDRAAAGRTPTPSVVAPELTPPTGRRPGRQLPGGRGRLPGRQGHRGAGADGHADTVRRRRRGRQRRLRQRLAEEAERRGVGCTSPRCGCAPTTPSWAPSPSSVEGRPRRAAGSRRIPRRRTEAVVDGWTMTRRPASLPVRSRWAFRRGKRRRNRGIAHGGVFRTRPARLPLRPLAGQGSVEVVPGPR